MSTRNRRQKKKTSIQKHSQKQQNSGYSAEDVFTMMNDTSQLIAEQNSARLSTMGPAATESGTLTNSVEFWAWMDRNYAKSGNFASSENMRSYMAGTPGQQKWANRVVQGKGYEWDWMNDQRKSFKNLFKTFDAGDVANRPGSDITEHNLLTGTDKEYQLKAYTSKNTPDLKNTPKDMAVVTNAEKVESVAGLGYEEVISYGDNDAIQTARDSRLDDMTSGKATPSYDVKNIGMAVAKAGMMGFIISASVETMSSYKRWKAGKISTWEYLKEIMKSGGNAGTTASFTAGIMIPITAKITTAGISSLVTYPISFIVTAAVDRVIAPAFARGDYLKILNKATYYKSLTDFCGSLSFTMEKASDQYSTFVNTIIDQQKAFSALSGDILSEQAIADFEYFANLPTDEVNIVISGMISLLQDTDAKYDSLKDQNFIQRMFKTVIGKNKATKQEIKENYDRLTVYISKSIEILLKRQCVDEKVIQIHGNEINSLCKGHVLLTAQVEALTNRVDNITNSLVLITTPGSAPMATSVREIADKGAQQKYKEAETLFLSGKLIDAYQLFIVAADNGVSRAFYYLGEYYSNGYGHIKENASTALEWWRKGMELGDPLSTYQYGLLQYDGNRVQADNWIKNHIHSVLELMKDNDPAALYVYGWHLITDNIGDSDAMIDSLGYFQKSAEMGYWPGGFLFYQYTEDYRQTGVELPNYLRLFEKVEWYGAQLMAGMAKMAFSPVDLNASAKHYQKALWLRDDIPEPAGYLAFLLNTGLVQESIGDGISVGNIQMYYAAGIKSHEPMALYQIGMLYYSGLKDGHGQDYRKAYENLELSYKYSKQGFTAGLLGYMNLISKGTDEDMNSAIHYLTEGYSMEDPNATRLLALCYKEGYGVEKDERKYNALMTRLKQLPKPDSYMVVQKFIKTKLDELTFS